MKRSGINMQSLRSDNHIYLWEWKLLDIFILNVCMEEKSRSYTPNSWWLTQLLFQNLLSCHAVYCLYRTIPIKGKILTEMEPHEWLIWTLSNRVSYVNHKGDLAHSFPLACCQSKDPMPLFYFRTFFCFHSCMRLYYRWDTLYSRPDSNLCPWEPTTYICPEHVHSLQWYWVKQIIVLFIYFIYLYIIYI